MEEVLKEAPKVEETKAPEEKLAVVKIEHKGRRFALYMEEKTTIEQAYDATFALREEIIRIAKELEDKQKEEKDAGK